MRRDSTGDGDEDGGGSAPAGGEDGDGDGDHGEINRTLDRIGDILAEGLTLRDSQALDAVTQEVFENGSE